MIGSGIPNSHNKMPFPIFGLLSTNLESMVRARNVLPVMEVPAVAVSVRSSRKAGSEDATRLRGAYRAPVPESSKRSRSWVRFVKLRSARHHRRKSPKSEDEATDREHNETFECPTGDLDWT